MSVLISPPFYSLTWVWEWLKALLLSLCCMLCGSFKVWPYQSWHLNAKENAGQACSSWGSCHQTIVMWNNGYISWIRWVQVESLLPGLPFLVFKIVLSTVSTICKENTFFPFSSFPPILYEYFRGKAFVWVVRKCGKTRLQGRGESSTRLEEWNSFSSLRVKWYFWLKARDIGVRKVQTGLARSLLRNGLRGPCLCPVVYCSIWVLTLCFLSVGSSDREITLSLNPQQNKTFKTLVWWFKRRPGSVLTVLLMFFWGIAVPLGME